MSPANNNTPALTWTVTTQAPATRPDRTGRIVPGMDVYFTTGSGASSSVFVPDSMYTPDQVKVLIAAKAAAIEGVANLNSGY